MIKHPVKLSAWSIFVTFLTILILPALAVCSYRGGMPHWWAYTIGGTIILLIIFAFIYMPVSISVDSQRLVIRHLIGRKTIPLKEIAFAQLCPPTMAERLILGSGGFFGYWGWFSQPNIGKYFAYYGKASDCFLVNLKNGRKYLLSCHDPRQILTHLPSGCQ